MGTIVRVDCRWLDDEITSNTGWVRDLQFKEWMAATAQRPTMLDVPESEWPAEVNPIPWIHVENQGSQGSCQGCALTNGAEFLYNGATGGVIHYSKQAAYIWSQQKRGIRGDRGSVCSDGVWVAENIGFCRESLWPYTGRYHTNPPTSLQECKSDARNYLIEGHDYVESPEDHVRLSATKRSCTHLGMVWIDLVDEQAANDGLIDEWRPGRGGGHSVEAIGYVNRHPRTGRDITHKGKPRIPVLNTWSVRWGDGGWSYWSFEAFEAMLRHSYTEAIALYGLRLGSDAVKPQLS